MKYFVASGVVLGVAICSPLYAGEAEKFWREMKSFNEKAAHYTRDKQNEVDALTGRMAALKEKSEQTRFDDRRLDYTREYDRLKLRREAALKEFAVKEVHFSEQNIAFAQRRLQMAEKHLANIEARDKQADNIISAETK